MQLVKTSTKHSARSVTSLHAGLTKNCVQISQECERLSLSHHVPTDLLARSSFRMLYVTPAPEADLSYQTN
jgi:hypothetical protein